MPALDTGPVTLAFLYAIQAALAEFDARQRAILKQRARLPYAQQPLDAAMWWNRRQQLLGGLNEKEIEQKIAEIERPVREANEQILSFDKGESKKKRKKNENKDSAEHKHL